MTASRNTGAAGGLAAAAGSRAPRGIVLAGTHSGVGKTSLALGVMGALGRRGYEVAPFKVGPDYIDPTYHTSVTGRPSRNLDTWLMPPAEAVGVFERAVAAVSREGTRTLGSAASEPVGAGSDATSGGRGVTAVVEGVMGLFDGLAGGGERCSTGEMAKLLGLPVVLVVDCSHTARSIAALVHGFATFDPDLTVSGVILNKVASPSHGRMVEEALAELVALRSPGGSLAVDSGSRSSPVVVGIVPRRADLHLESRHLGLIPTVEDRGVAEVLARIVDHVAEHVNLETLLDLAAPLPAGGPTEEADVGSSTGPLSAAPGRRRRVAVARDAAFSFYYQDNLDVLEEEGAELLFFQPTEGDGLPDCDAVYLGGGYPEVYAAELAANTGLGRDLREAVASGLPLYAECGGYLYLGREIEDVRGIHAMAGVLPTRASMTGARLRMGYVEARASERHPLAGATFRGHLFHYSATTGSDAPAYHVTRKGETVADGYADGRIAASYVHLHFRGSRRIARWLAGTDITEEVLHHA
ncbi:MAG: cobyrinate a,c-diamide synthase [Thermoleophilia bacterium]